MMDMAKSPSQMSFLSRTLKILSRQLFKQHIQIYLITIATKISCKKKDVVASTKHVVDKINDYALSLIPSEEKEYCSADSIDKSDELLNPAFGVLTPEFLNSLKTSGIPNHKLKIKVGTPIILLWNLDNVDGLCNRTRLM